MKQTTKRFFSMAISFVLFTLTLIVYFNFILPANDEGQAVKAQMISRQNFVDSQKAAISQVEKLLNSYKGEGKPQDRISSMLPVSPDVAGAFSQMSGLLQANSLLTQSIIVNLPASKGNSSRAGEADSGSQVSVKPLGTVDFHVRMIGTYEDFKSFLGNLETNIRIFDVERISVQPTGRSNQDIYTYDLTVKAYYQVPS